MACPQDKITYKLCANSCSFEQNPDAVRVTVGTDCVKARIVTPDVIKISICEVINVGGSGTAPERTAFTMVAETNLNGLRVVAGSDSFIGQAVYADHNNIPQASKVLGITRSAVLAGNSVEVIDGGSINDPSWNWIDGPIFLGTDGKLTQSAPTVGFVLTVGKAVSANRISLNMERPIILN